MTGAELLRLRGESASTIERLLRESTSFYLATLDADPSDRGVARLEVRTSRDNVTIRARPRIALTTPSPDAGRKTAVSPRDMLRQNRGYAEFGIRTIGYAGSNPGDTRVRVIALTEVEPDVKVAEAAVGISIRRAGSWRNGLPGLRKSPAPRSWRPCRCLPARTACAPP